jgi:hypothetical protein
MPNTPIFNFPYPDPTDAPDGPTQLQDLAESVESAVDDIYAGIAFGGDVSVGGNLSTDGTLTVSGTSTLNTVNAGDISGGSLSTTGDIETDGDVYAHGLAVARLVKGKVHTGSLVDTSTTSDSYQNISSANIQNVPVIAGHAYKAEFQVAVTSSVANDRIRYSLWNGTVGGTQCGAIIPIVRAEAASTFRVQTFSFIWEAPSTETISNLNLAMLRFSGTGSVQTRVESSSYYGLVYDLGPSGVITNL